MGSNLKKVLEGHHEQVSKNPKINFERIRKVKYLHEFDREVQCHLWDYPTEGAYYRDASSVDSILAARIPVFAINAKDDPVSVYPRPRDLSLFHRSRSTKRYPT